MRGRRTSRRGAAMYFLLLQAGQRTLDQAAGGVQPAQQRARTCPEELT